jgi:hypothetical protein
LHVANSCAHDKKANAEWNRRPNPALTPSKGEKLEGEKCSNGSTIIQKQLKIVIYNAAKTSQRVN